MKKPTRIAAALMAFAAAATMSGCTAADYGNLPDGEDNEIIDQLPDGFDPNNPRRRLRPPWRRPRLRFRKSKQFRT